MSIRYGRHTYADGDPIVHSYVAVGEPEPDIRIGAYCSIAAEVEFLPGGMHDTRGVSTFPWYRLSGSGAPTLRGPIRIGHDVWIGRGARFLGGVTVGDGAIIGAWAVVAKDVPPYHTAVGNPLRILPRKPHAMHAPALQRIAWWDWPDKDERLADVRTLTVEEFLKRHGGAW